MIRLHQFEISPFCDKVRRALHWKRLPYEVVEVPLSKAFTSVRRVNPVGKLPTLEHDGRFVADSTDILEYLEESFPEPPLFPKDRALRAQCHVLEDWADESLYFYEMRLRFTLPHNARRFVPELTKYDPGWMKTAAGFLVPQMMRSVLSRQGLGRKPPAMVVRDVERHVGAIEGWLGGRDWLLGDALSAADLAVFAQMHCIRGADEGARIVGASKPVTAWMGRVESATAKPA
ncbi:MAG TPA: glutathione S-transferase family protein [Myxococcota bacterium]|jgi:glutathione S-transferase|nr:glutathione S-transferase family protein [Myxococcota bacterium]